MDANGWIALNNNRDQFHFEAQKLNRKLLKERYHYITTNFVLNETYTGLLMKVGHLAAVDFGERIRRSKVTTVIHVSDEIEENAWQFFKRYSDKFFSFTDCTSFIIMQQLNLSEAFTNDHHFVQAGFSILLQGK